MAMTMDNFLSFLQQILTMVDPKDTCSVELARTALTTVCGLARSSEKSDAITYRSMSIAIREFDYLVANSQDFVGKPGEYQKNLNKRQRLAQMIKPGC